MIEVDRLRKVFGPIVAVDDASFQVAQGDVLGFLGPNGAGKTTTMRMLACFLHPDAGTARVAGHDVIADPVGARRALGYLAEGAPLYEEMTVHAFLKFVCDARALRGANRVAAIDRVVADCAIHRVMDQTIGTLSKGYRRRVGLAQALVHDPGVLILDEPTDGLDPNQKHHVRELIRGLAARKCIVISTHILEEVEAICNRLILIDRGQVRVDSTPSDLRAREGGTLDEIFRKLTAATDAQAKGGAA